MSWSTATAFAVRMLERLQRALEHRPQRDDLERRRAEWIEMQRRRAYEARGAAEQRAIAAIHAPSKERNA